ncbi:arsenite-transporting ATPase [Halalkaliarchaeum desulfuricum]|uniref:Arsenite-transporting ATPase n=1 Tax=Halalkaliarchaeum desulfuricum TaxID=2055893 RepID=A0A343THB4_9EURY|nr:TRC40/GET3/ArsA family transport-energizing ATPase [Halalkaliarchaeum desulfuricum]AUX08486.1 arsenite-transporting ATPase [Halalkaliarchaeum desulfuricum]
MSEIDVEPVDRVEESEETDRDDAVDPVDEAEPNGERVDDELDVEPTTDLPAGVDAPEYVLYGGKGGVGKTTMAAATALSSAAGGTATLVVSTDPAHSLSDTFGVDIPAEPARIREDLPLYAAEIDPDAAMEAGLFGGGGEFGGGAFGEGEGFGEETGGEGDGFAGAGGAGNPLGELLGGDGIDPLLGGTMPGADEAAAMQQLLEHLDDPRFDRVVIDTAPTGHTLRLLQLPEIMDSMVGEMLKLRQRLSGMMEGFKGMFGGGEGPVGDAADLEQLRERIERLRAVLRDPDRTDFRVVLIPEEMSVVESERLVGRLEEFGIPVGTIVVNRVMEEPDRVAGGDRNLDDDWLLAPNHENCAFCRRRWEVQQTALRRATELFRGRDVKRVPLLAGEVKGDAALRVVAACLDA